VQRTALLAVLASGAPQYHAAGRFGEGISPSQTNDYLENASFNACSNACDVHINHNADASAEAFMGTGGDHPTGAQAKQTLRQFIC
jgi:hypothetical protein